MAVGASVLAGIAAAPVLIAAATYEGWRHFKVRQQVNQSIRELNTAISELRDRRPAIIKVTVPAQIQSQNLVRRTAALRTAMEPDTPLPSQTQISALIAALEKPIVPQ